MKVDPHGIGTTYDPMWKGLHWLMAMLFLGNVALGLYASNLPPGLAPRPALLDIHKSTGIALFALVLARLAWRLTHSHPALPSRFGPFTRVISMAVHATLYVLMLGMPLSGYVDSIAGGHPFRWFGLFPVPVLLPRDPAISTVGGTVHLIGAYSVYALVGLHIAAALWHAARRDGVMARMLPTQR